MCATILPEMNHKHRGGDGGFYVLIAAGALRKKLHPLERRKKMGYEFAEVTKSILGIPKQFMYRVSETHLISLPAHKITVP